MATSDCPASPLQGLIPLPEQRDLHGVIEPHTPHFIVGQKRPPSCRCPHDWVSIIDVRELKKHECWRLSA
jgi:hypothetical protein